MHRKLCRLAHRSDEDQKGDDGNGGNFKPAARPERKSRMSVRGPDEELLEIQGAIQTESKDET